MALGPLTSGDNCRPFAVASPLEAYAGVGIDAVEGVFAGDWAYQTLLKAVVRLTEKA
jgi:hypothetical protein